MYDVKCDVNYCVYNLQYGSTDASEYLLPRTIGFNTRGSANNLIEDAVVPELVYMQNNSAVFTYEAIY